MKHDISVAVVLKHDFGMEIESLSISDLAGNVIHLTKEQWKEVNDTLNGKREVASSGSKDGAYYPDFMVLWN